MNITQAETSFGDVEVIKIAHERYNVAVNGEVKHPACTAEDAMRALSHYLQSEGYKLKKLQATIDSFTPRERPNSPKTLG